MSKGSAMNPCPDNDEEITVDLPLEHSPARGLGLVPPISNGAQVPELSLEALEEEEPTVVEFSFQKTEFSEKPPSPQPSAQSPLPDAVQRLFLEWRRQIRLARDFESIHYADTLHQKTRRFLKRLTHVLKENQKTSWDYPPKAPFTLKNFLQEWRRQVRLTRDFESVHYSNTLHQKARRWVQRFILRAKANQKSNWDYPPEIPFTLRGIFQEWRRQIQLTREYERIHFANTPHQKVRRYLQSRLLRIKANMAKCE